jgi:hypothetical protein
MRTTLNLDDDVYSLAKGLAESRRISLGAALSYLARKGASEAPRFVVQDGFPVFCVDEGQPKFGPEDVEAALEADDLRYASQFIDPKR